MTDFEEDFFKGRDTYTIRSDAKIIQILVKLLEEFLELFGAFCWQLIGDLTRNFLHFKSALNVTKNKFVDLGCIFSVYLGDYEVVSNAISVLQK